jgi:hypothetical protein
MPGRVLFLNELGEFPAHVCDGLRQPLGDQRVTIARRGATVWYPDCPGHRRHHLRVPVVIAAMASSRACAPEPKFGSAA